jgi:hypothetical protein
MFAVSAILNQRKGGTDMNAYAPEIEALYTNHPDQVTVDGVRYFATGKVGTNRATGILVVEMEAEDCRRVWVAQDGTVFAD